MKTSVGLSCIPYCTYLYVVDTDSVQISNNVRDTWFIPDHNHRNRSERPYIKETIPAWGSLLSDAYISLPAIPQTDIAQILDAIRALRTVDMTIYLCTASINIFNGMIRLTFSYNGSHYMNYDTLLTTGPTF